MFTFDSTIKEILNERLSCLERHFDADVVFYYGEIHPSYEKQFRDFIEKMKEDVSASHDDLVVVLNTPGGSAETVEKMVGIMRFHYKTVHFVVPDYAMSAGTILCMSGDKIYMDYSSALGPIDPQVFNGKEYVPALGYLDQVERLLEKAKSKTITEAEFLILQAQDLAMLNSYEQARNLTVTLLKKWLVEYKFKDWNQHKDNRPVSTTEKEQRAEEIAVLFGNNKLWHSHGRYISVTTLQSVFKLKIEDYSTDTTLRKLVRDYNDLLIEYIGRTGFKVFLHSRFHF